MAANAFGRRRVEMFVGLAGAVGLLAGCGGGSSGKKSASASTVAPATSSTPAPTTSGTQAPVLNLASGRALHTATLLKSGEVLVIGGVDASGAAIDQTALVTATSVKAGPRLLSARVGHTATLLENGQVLISGGQADLKSTTALDSCEIFDPLAGSIAQGPKLPSARSQHTACAFGPVGAQKVLIAGGFDGKTPLDSAELFDVKTGAFTTIKGKMAEAVAGAHSARLDDGSIVIGGGDGLMGPAGAQVFDPATATFKATTITVKRSGAAFAASGREALLAGGQSATGVERTTELYDIATKLFAAGPQLADGRRDATASVVAGQVVVIGGRSATGALASVEVLKGGVTFAQATTNPSADLKAARYGHTATALSGGTVMVIGGFDAAGGVLASCENVDPAAPPAVGTPVAPPVVAPPTVVTPPTTGGTTPPPSGGSGGLGGLLGGLLGGGAGSSGGSSSLLGKIGSAALTTITTNGFSGGIGGFFKSFLGNLVNQFVPGLIGGGSSSSGSGSSSGGVGGVISSLLGGLFGGGSSSTPAPSPTAPAVQSMSPGAGKVGDTVQITGFNFGATVSVKFTKSQGFFSKALSFVTGSKPTVDAQVLSVTASGNATVVTCTVPADAADGDVKVTTNGATVSAGNFDVQ